MTGSTTKGQVEAKTWSKVKVEVVAVAMTVPEANAKVGGEAGVVGRA